MDFEQMILIPYEWEESIPGSDWSIWKLTELDWSILRGLPGNSSRVSCKEETEECQRLLNECRYGE